MSCGRLNRGGFTLIELLVVAGILVALMGIFLPALTHATGLARRIACQGNLRQIVAGVALYAQAHGGVMPAAAPHELGGAQGRVAEGDPWLPAKMFGGGLPAEKRPLNAYLDSPEVFRSPCDRGEPLWWFDTGDYQARSTCYELYGSSYFYVSGYNRIGGVAAPMGLAKFVGVDFSFEEFAEQPLPLGESLSMTHYRLPAKKVVVASIPIYRTMSGVVAISPRAQWYVRDAEHLWANAAFLDGHVKFVQVFAYDSHYGGVMTPPSEDNPYY
ncbi:MAG: type II secretion system protein [Kiritimatiellae bacterium]|nr:type II secretion system protein [Kiritimatiellia bacterium]MCO5067780.1 type II secretion system GspH family protein [Kiritimatiellia bacterium]